QRVDLYTSRARPSTAVSAYPSKNSGLDQPKKMSGKYFSLRPNFRCALLASTFRLVCNLEHNFPAGVVCRSLLLRRDGFTERQDLRHDWLDFSGVDQLSDLGKIRRIRMSGDTRAMNPAFL